MEQVNRVAGLIGRPNKTLNLINQALNENIEEKFIFNCNEIMTTVLANFVPIISRPKIFVVPLSSQWIEDYKTFLDLC
jgi:hypothetical protein